MNFYSLTAQQFEDLCYQYTCRLYKNKHNYSLKHTRFVHDGGRDIEITFYDEISHFKVWAECKRHKESIGLEEIGKNVVLVLSNHISKVIFFSASDITLSARIEISKISEALGFEVAFLYGENFKKALSEYPDIVNKFFPDYVISSVESPTINVSFSICETNQSIFIPIKMDKSVILRDGRLINLYILFTNLSNKMYDSISVKLKSAGDDLFFVVDEQCICEIMPKTDRIIVFRGQIINQNLSEIIMPDVLINFEKEGRIEKRIESLPALDTSKCKKYPLIGKKVNEFLNVIVGNLADFNHAYPYIFDIRGISGVGKSRLATEIANRFIMSGFELFSLDCQDYNSYIIIHKLLCYLLNVPLYKGRIDYEKKDIMQIVEKSGGSSDFQDIVSDFLIECKIKNNNLYYLQEAFLYYLMHPNIHKKQLIVIDNVQLLEPELLDFFTNILETIIYMEGYTSIIFITNTERETVLGRQRMEIFLDYLDNMCYKHPHTFIQYECEPFNRNDATLLLKQLFEIQDSKSPIITEFLKKSGYIVFELVQFLEYLNDKKIIEWIDSKSWHIKKDDEFLEFLYNCPVSSKTIIKDRVKYLKHKYNKKEYSQIKDVISAILCFQNFLPYYYLSSLDIDDNIIEIMQDDAWINRTDRGITFFHDNLYYYFKEDPTFCKNIPILKKVILSLDDDIDILSDIQKKLIHFFCLYNQGNITFALEYGINLIDICYESGNKRDAIEIAEVMLHDKKMLDDKIIQIKTLLAYANLIFEVGQKDKAYLIYQETLPMLLKNQTIFDTEYLLGNLHKIVNSQLQLAYYDAAMETLKLMEQCCAISDMYKFIIQNRYGVAYTCMGNFYEAQKRLDKSLEIASIMGSDFWISTSYSDIALRYFYDYTIGERRSLLVKESLQKALSYSHTAEKNFNYRNLELYWHKAIICIIDNNFEKALYFLDNCILKSKENNFLYEIVRAYNLKALVYLLIQKYDDAQTILFDCLHLCEIYHFSSGLFRMYNNLGVCYAITQNVKIASIHFSNAINSLHNKNFGIKQYPVIINSLLISIKHNNLLFAKQLEDICNQINDEVLFDYKLKLKHSIQKNKQPSNFTFWTFDGFGYIF